MFEITQLKLETDMRSLARTCIRKNGDFEPFFLLYAPDGEYVLQKLGTLADHLNDARMKTVIFASIRLFVEHVQARAVIIGTDSWQFVANERGRKLMDSIGHEEFMKKYDQGYATLIREGYGSREEAITFTGQTPEFMSVLCQPYDREGSKMTLRGEPDIKFTSTEEFSGKAKMFGPPSEEVAKVMAEIKAAVGTDPYKTLREKFEGEKETFKEWIQKLAFEKTGFTVSDGWETVEKSASSRSPLGGLGSRLAM